jgi:undecaprenyl-diphosphatase
MLDSQILHLVNNMAGQNPALDAFFIFTTVFGNLLLFAIILYSKNEELACKCIIAYLFAVIIDLGINLLYHRPRPFIAEEVNLLIAQRPTSSFPSRHAMTAFAFAQLFYFWSRKYMYCIFVFILAFLIVFSRIFVGVHYPLDTAAGIVLGIGIAFLVEHLFKKYLMKRIKSK